MVVARYKVFVLTATGAVAAAVYGPVWLQTVVSVMAIGLAAGTLAYVLYGLWREDFGPRH